MGANAIESELHCVPQADMSYGICYMHNQIVRNARIKTPGLDMSKIVKITHATYMKSGIQYRILFEDGKQLEGLVPINLLDKKRIY